MEQSQRRTEVLGPLKARVATAIGARLDDRILLQLALACAMREPDELVEFLAPRHITSQVLKNRLAVAITSDEWMALFGYDVAPLRDGGVTSVVQCEDFRTEANLLGEAMKCTVAEQEQGERWKRAWVRALCYVAVHFEKSDEAVTTTLGMLVRADARRMEDMRETLDDQGVETVLMTKVLKALSESVI